LGDADLSRADLTRANLRWANLNNANLTGADLKEVDLTDAEVSPQALAKARSVTEIIRSDAGHFETPPEIILPTKSGPLPNPKPPTYVRETADQSQAADASPSEPDPE
jgi:hypothetical protein